MCILGSGPLVAMHRALISLPFCEVNINSIDTARGEGVLHNAYRNSYSDMSTNIYILVCENKESLAHQSMDVYFWCLSFHLDIYLTGWKQQENEILYNL